MSELIAVRLPEEMIAGLRARAEERGTTVSDIIRSAVSIYTEVVPEIGTALHAEAMEAIAAVLTRRLVPVVGEVMAEVERASQAVREAQRQATKEAKSKAARKRR